MGRLDTNSPGTPCCKAIIRPLASLPVCLISLLGRPKRPRRRWSSESPRKLGWRMFPVYGTGSIIRARLSRQYVRYDSRAKNHSTKLTVALSHLFGPGGVCDRSFFPSCLAVAQIYLQTGQLVWILLGRGVSFSKRTPPVDRREPTLESLQNCNGLSPVSINFVCEVQRVITCLGCTCLVRFPSPRTRIFGAP